MEMEKLIAMLEKAGIPHEVVTHWSGTKQVYYPSAADENRVCDAVCFRGSYGWERGLLEIMGLVEVDYDDVEGYLTAEDVFSRIEAHYKNSH